MDIQSIARSFEGLAAATVYESNGKSGDMAPSIRPLQPGVRLAGPAFTVRCLPGDLAAVRRAVDAAPPGHVLVIDAGGTERATVWGGSGSIAAQRRGLAGMVTNGSTRDAAQIRQLGFPVFCAGISVRGGLRQHEGWHQVPVSVGDAVVHPGDWIVADDDGVVVVAGDRVEAVLAKAQQKARAEAERERRLRDGEPYDI
ncbi:MAG: RraA family protein [Lautropia sp.]